jgi:hypothetical protein
LIIPGPKYWNTTNSKESTTCCGESNNDHPSTICIAAYASPPSSTAPIDDPVSLRQRGSKIAGI